MLTNVPLSACRATTINPKYEGNRWLCDATSARQPEALDWRWVSHIFGAATQPLLIKRQVYLHCCHQLTCLHPTMHRCRRSQCDNRNCIQASHEALQTARPALTAAPAVDNLQRSRSNLPTRRCWLPLDCDSPLPWQERRNAHGQEHGCSTQQAAVRP